MADELTPPEPQTEVVTENTEATEELQTVADQILEDTQWLKTHQSNLSEIQTRIESELSNLRLETRNNSERLNQVADSLQSIRSQSPNPETLTPETEVVEVQPESVVVDPQVQQTSHEPPKRKRFHRI